jgi:hypothetical protein
MSYLCLPHQAVLKWCFQEKQIAPQIPEGLWKEKEARKDMLTLPRSHCLKRCNLLFHPAAFALRAFEFFPFIFRNLHRQGKFLMTLIALEFIYRHF